MKDYFDRTIPIFTQIGFQIALIIFTFFIVQEILNSMPDVFYFNSIIYNFMVAIFMVLDLLLSLFSTAVILLILKAHLEDSHFPFPDAIREAIHIFPLLVNAWVVPFLKIILGIFLLVIPGIYFMYQYYYISHELIFRNANANKAGGLSVSDTVGWKAKLFKLDIFMVVLIIFSTIFIEFLASGFYSEAFTFTYTSYGEPENPIVTLVTDGITAIVYSFQYILITLIFIDIRDNGPIQNAE